MDALLLMLTTKNGNNFLLPIDKLDLPDRNKAEQDCRSETVKPHNTNNMSSAVKAKILI